MPQSLRRFTRRHDVKSRAGQGLVEFALVIPILLLFLTVSIDFGRIYLGWVNLQNMARIAANFAGNNAEEFSVNDPATLALYQKQILNDAKNNNCRIHDAGGANDKADAPVFTGYEVGDTATVSITCTFQVVTPIISNIVGSTVAVSASSQFPVKTGIIAATNSGGGGGGGSAVTASFSCTPKNGSTPLIVQCNDESGGNPSTWSWTVTGPGGATQTSTQQDPQFTLSAVGTYSVSLTADNALNQPDTLTFGGYLTVGNPSTVDFIADKNSGKAPLTVTFTDQSSDSPTSWAWDFQNDGTVDSTAKKPTFTYTKEGTYSVKLTVMNASGGPFSLVKKDFIVVSIADCNVPSFTDVRRNNAQSLWGPSGAGFTTIVQDAPGAPNGNYIIGFQSITPGSIVPCNSAIEVNR
jgi:PKD repeat protein